MSDPSASERGVEHWLSRPASERLAEVERLRRERWGEKYDARPMEKGVRAFKNGVLVREVRAEGEADGP